MRSPARLAAALGLLLAACTRVSDAPCAVLITLDTTRADAIGCFGGKKGVAPRIDELARSSVVYLSASTVAPVTLPSHASMLTGLVPPRHGVRDNGLRPLPGSARTVAEIAKDGGCATAAFVSAAVLEGAWGLGQGFDVYDEPAPERDAPTAHIAERTAADVVAAAKRWLEERETSKPYFLWVHLFDPHAPYEPAPRFLEQGEGQPYWGEVAATDHAVGELVDALSEDPAWDRTTVVVVADHGESLGQHGEATHSIFCYHPVIRVPLLVRHPGGARGGEKSTEVASVVDVAPTIADALGLPAPPEIDGISLARGSVPRDRGAYFESYVGYLNHGWSPIVGWTDARGKLVVDAGAQLFRPESDAFEKQDFAEREPGEVERYRARIAEIARRPALPPDAPGGAGAADEGALERIRALGYAGAGDPEAPIPAPLAETGRPSPRKRLAELNHYYGALEQANAGQVDGAIARLEAVVRDNSRNVAALDALGLLLSKAGRERDAIPVLEGILARGARRVTTHASLGRCYEAVGEKEKALAQYLAAAALRPEGAREAEDVARALTALGREEEAGKWRAARP